MQLRWPIEDPQLGYLQLIDAALEDYTAVLARLGYFPIGLPRDWEIQTMRLREKGRDRTNVLVCVVEVLPVAAREAA
jgi:hypothetical protein